MDGRMARHTLDPLRRINKLINFRVGIIKRFEFRRNIQRFFYGHMKIRRNELCNFVNVLIRHTERSPDVAYCRPRGKGSEGDYLCNVILAVFAVDVFDYLLSAFITEVYIKVRHRNAFRVKESLEKKMIFYRINIGDSYAVGADASRAGTPSGTDRNTNAFCVIDKIMDYKIIVNVAHAFDNSELIIQPVPKLLIRVFTVAAIKPFPAHTFKIFNVIPSVRNLKSRKLRVPEFKGHIAAVGNFLGIVNSFRNIREYLTHLLLGFYVKFICFKSHVVIFSDDMVRTDAYKNVLHFRIVLVYIVAVVGRNKRDPRFFGKLYKIRQNTLLVCIAVILYFDKIVIFTENIAVFQSCFFCRFIIVLRKIARNFARKAGRKSDYALMMLAEKLLIDPRFLIKSFGESGRNKLDQIFIASIVFAKKNEMIAPVHHMFLAETGTVRNVNLASDYRLYSVFVCFAVKINNAIHCTVVCYGNSGLTQFLDARNKLFYSAGTVEQAVFSMEMKMCEAHIFLLGFQASSGSSLCTVIPWRSQSPLRYFTR